MKRFGLCLGLMLLFVIPTANPAYAVCCEPWGAKGAAAVVEETAAEKTSWVTQFTNWAKQFEFLKTIIGLGSDLNDRIGEATSSVGAAVVGGQTIQTQARVQIARGLSDTDAQTEVAAVQAQTMGERTAATVANAQLCNMVLTRQAPELIKKYADSVSVKILEMIENRDRGIGTDGSGPIHIGEVLRRRCDTQMVSPLDNRQEKCTAPTPVPGEPSLIDADLSLREGEVLQMPPIVPKPVTDRKSNV